MPDYVNTRTTLGDNATLEALTSRSIKTFVEDGVDELRPYAFSMYRNLTSVNLPNLTVIGERAFSYCIKLSEVIVPKLTTIRAYGFEYCGALPSMSFPYVTLVENHGFDRCTTLTQLEFGSTCTFQGSTFYGCSELTTLILRGSSVCTMTATNAFSYTKIKTTNGRIYVPANLVDAYKSATNWSGVASYIYPITE